MSTLLTSLMRAGTLFQQALDKRSVATEKPVETAGQTAERADAASRTETGNDDRFIQTGNSTPDPFRQKVQRLALADYKQALGKDVAFVRETLRHKLAEYNQHPATGVSVTRNRDGRLAIDGKLADPVRQQIEKDLNNNQNFLDAFRRLSASEPTLHFVDNAVRLSEVYGVGNTLLETLVSADQQFNGLQDLVHRYQSLRQNAGITGSTDTGSYAFSLNLQA